MCQTLAERAGLEDSNTYFTVGLLSTLDALTHVSMEQVLEHLPLSDDLNRALLEGEGSLGEALAGPDLRSVFVLSDGLSVNGTPLSRALSEAVGSVVVSGGLAGDDDRFEQTWVLAGGERASKRIAAVGLYGDALKVSCGSGGGWEPFGVTRRISGSDGNVLYTLDDRPALELYKEYLGDRASGLPATALLFPLALELDDDTTLVRTILAVDEDTQSMTFAGDMPEGARVKLMRSDMEGLVDGAAQAAESLDSSGPTLMVAVSCVGRRLVLGEEVEEEVEATLEAQSHSVQVGFYSYGELSPGSGRSCALHNQTMTLTAWSEG